MFFIFRPRPAAVVLAYLMAGAGAFSQLLTSQNPGRVASGYVFYAPTSSETSYLLRNDGSVAHSWPGSGPAGLAVKLLPNGSILRTGTLSSAVFYSGRGVGGTVEKRSWEGELLWRYSLPDPGRYIQHHDVEAMPNGNVLIIGWELRTAVECAAAGRDPVKTPAAGIWSEAIFEVRPEGPTTGTIVWEWHVWDHLVQGSDPGAPHSDATGNSRRVDVNFVGNNANPSGNPDWLHFNSVSYNADLDQILVSSRTWSEIWVIDHSTTSPEAASSRGGRRDRGGDLLYRYGNPQAYGAGTVQNQVLFGPHNAHWIDAGLPGAGHMLVFNNGLGRGYSSADELAPMMDPSGDYQADVNGRYAPSGPIWSFGSNGGANFYTATAGGAQRLRNGNTMLCLSNANRVVEVTQEGEIVWDLNLGAGEAGGFTFRANRFPADSVELAATPFAAAAPRLYHAARFDSSHVAPGTLAFVVSPGLVSASAVRVVDGLGATHSITQIDARADGVTIELPAATAVGPARLTIEGRDGAAQVLDFRVNPVSPGLFAANGDGKGVGVAVASIEGPHGWIAQPAYRIETGTQSFVADAIPLEGDVYVSLYGTGFGTVGNDWRATVGGIDVPVVFAAPLGSPRGILQVSIGPIPAVLKGKARQPVVIEQNGERANPVEISFL